MTPRPGPLAGALGLALAAACGSGVRTVPFGPHAEGAATPTIVDVPPPPAKIEQVPPDPGPPCAWLDGYFRWVDETWTWQPGGWVKPPPGCHFAPPEAVWVPSTGRGLLFYLAGQWYPDEPRARCEPAVACGGPAGPPRRAPE